MEDIKEKINQILIKNTLKEQSDAMITYIPEIKFMIGFEHKHPHHNLDVWNHTIKVVEGLENEDLEIKMAGLLHDIGKPFSYQEGSVRHFHGHPDVSAEMSKQILTRLGYNPNFIQDVYYFVKMHDTIIDPENLTNSVSMVRRLLKLQYADARAHHPDKIEKRINTLNEIKSELDAKVKKQDSER